MFRTDLVTALRRAAVPGGNLLIYGRPTQCGCGHLSERTQRALQGSPYAELPLCGSRQGSRGLCSQDDGSIEARVSGGTT